MILPRWTDFRFGFVEDPATIGIDGVPPWPVDRVRADSFDGGFTGIGRPISTFPITVSCDSEATTSAARHYWYLSQRTDDPTLQWLSIAHAVEAKSGTVTIALTSRCVSDLGLASATTPLDDGQLREILKHVSLYVIDRLTFAIQWVPMLQYALSSY